MTVERSMGEVADQAAFYDAQHQDALNQENLSRPTRLWRLLRWRFYAYNRALGIQESITRLHRSWLGDISEKSVLDLGCFSGNPLSVYLAEQAKSYVGIDLSPKAIAELEAKVDHCPAATCIAGDIFAAGFSDGQFDVVYAKAVLHHFEDASAILGELSRLLAPGGLLVTYDPLQTDPVIALARAVYRPFQDDAAWEWPFSRDFFRAADQYFDFEAIRGSNGLARLGLPLSVVSPKLATKVGRWGDRLDAEYATRRDWRLWICWKVALKLRKLP